MIGSQWCNLFMKRTIFCFKSHLFLSQWKKMKEKSHCLANLAIIPVFSNRTCVVHSFAFWNHVYDFRPNCTHCISQLKEELLKISAYLLTNLLLHTSRSINVAAGLKKLSRSYLGIRVIFPRTDDLSLQSPICHALMTLEFLLGDETGLD